MGLVCAKNASEKFSRLGTFKELINEIIYPVEESARERYLQQTIDDLKERSKKKSKAINPIPGGY
jgi:hypothetical protein